MTPARHHPGLRLAAALALWAALLAALRAHAGDHTPVSRLLLAPHRPLPGPHRADTFYRLTHPDGSVTWLPQDASADPLTRALQDNWGVIEIVDLQSTHPIGLLWPWGTRSTSTQRITTLAGTPDPEGARAGLAAYARAQGHDDDAHRIELGRQSTLNLDWSGPIMDLITLLLALWTAREAARAIAHARTARVRRALHKGLCPTCGYTLTPPTDAPVRCPECGQSWTNA